MTAYAIFSLTAFVVYLFAGIYPVVKYKRDAVSILFMLTCLSLAVWSFAYAFVYMEYSVFWIKLSSVGWCFFSALVLHTMLRFARISFFLKPLPQALLYVIPGILLFMRVFMMDTGAGISGVNEVMFQWLDNGYDLIYQLAALGVAVRMRLQSQNRRQRKLLELVLASAALTFAANYIFQFVLPVTDLPDLPAAGQLYCLSLILGVTWANHRYGLFSLSEHVLYDEILTEMMDSFFLLSTEGRIQRINRRTVGLLGYSQEELENLPLRDLCVEKDVIDTIVSGSNTSDTTAYAEVSFMSRTGRMIPLRLSFSRIKDKSTGDVLGIMTIGQDIAVKKRLQEEIRIHQEFERKLRESEERFRAMFDKHSAVMCLVDPESLQILSVNNAALAFYGYSFKDFEAMKLTALDGTSLQEGVAMARHIVQEQSAVLHMKHKLADGDIRDVEIHSSAVPFGKRSIIYSIIHDITERKKAEDYISFLAYNDSLTGLSNRKMFYERVEKAIEAAKSAGGVFAVIYIDMDDLKFINDTYGHEDGDTVLRELGRRMNELTRSGLTAARLGGDEFAMLLPGVGTMKEALMAVDDISQHLRKSIQMGAREINVQASIGISLYPSDGEDVESLLKQADFKMYAVKKERKSTKRFRATSENR
ncbi:MAG: domain S-box/diguanylate cyclase protein [Paenibacillaceae bacterium]|jgi:diguanylate cyclase (GGDEF)-like protein/PAS domain S-box-containing protein|nr:domain S-box/diguanylate cyclase protein [Paenibacillaceae bacterium]